MTLLTKSNSLFPEMPSLFSGFFDDHGSFNTDGGWMPKWISKVPAANITENKGAFSIELAVPGMEKKDFQIDIENGSLTISCKKEEETKKEEENYTRQEFSYNSFRRSFALPEFVDEENIKANYKNGVLKLALPKNETLLKAPKRAIAIG